MKKTIIIFSILLTFFIVGLISYPKIWTYHLISSKYSQVETPSAYIVPVSRLVEAPRENFTDYSSYRCDNLKFNAPWKVLREKEERENFMLLTFFSGTKKGIYMNRGKVTEYKIAERLLGDNPLEAKKITQILGAHTLKSNYTIISASYNTTPNQASFFKSSSDLRKIAILLNVKMIFTESTIKKIYKFETKDIKGFQFGDTKDTNTVLVQIFSKYNRIHRMSILSATQEEIDFILSSMKTL